MFTRLLTNTDEVTSSQLTTNTTTHHHHFGYLSFTNSPRFAELDLALPVNLVFFYWSFIFNELPVPLMLINV